MTFKTSLSQKVLLIIGSLIILALIVILYISNAIILTSFTRLEEQKAYTNVERVQKSIEGELNNLASICGDWAPWDDARNFMLGRAPDFNNTNLTVASFVNLHLDFMIFIDTSGRIFHVTAIDSEKGIFSQVSPELINRILADKSLLQLKEPAENTSGLIILSEKTVLVSAQPISSSQAEKPLSGTLIVGRYLNNNLLKALSENTRLDIIMASSQDPKRTPDFEQARDKLSKDNNIVIRIPDRNIIAGYTNIYDLDGNKYITLKTKMPREIYTQGRQTIHYFMAAIILTVTAILAILLFVMQKIILQPINKLTKNFADIHNNCDTDTKLYTERNDEIGTLARSFDEMMQTLKKRLSDLHESEKRFEEVAENSGDWIWEINAEGLYTYSNPVAEKIIGYKPQEIIGKKYFYDFFTPDQRENLKTAAFQVFARQEKFTGFINHNIHKNGSTVILETHGTPIIDGKGNLCGYRGADRDITERKKAQDDLIQLLSLHTATLESTGNSLIVVDLDGKIVSYNQKFLQMWQITESLVADKNDKKLFEFLADQLANPEQFTSEIRRMYSNFLAQSLDTVEFKDGRIYERHSQPQRINNMVVGRVWSFRDVTERKLIERDLDESRQMLQLVIDSIPHAIFWKNRRSTYLGCNANFAKDVGLAGPGDIMGKTDYSLPNKKENADLYREYDKKVMDSDSPQYHAIEQQKLTDGKLVWLDTTRVPLHDAKGNVVGILGSYDDITERKEISDMYNNSPCGYHSLDKDGTFIRINDTELAWLGYTRQDVVGKMKFSDFLTSDSLKIFPEKFLQFKERGWVSDLEFEMVCRDGTILPVIINSTAVKDDSGNYIQSRSTMTKITKHLQTEENLHESTASR